MVVYKEKQYINSLSGGEKQKLSVLLTIIPIPEIIFLDELTTGLDTFVRREVREQLLLLKEQGLTILLTSHYMDEVHALCDRIAILVEGKIGFLGTPEELIVQSKKHSLEEAYLWYTREESR